MSDSPVINFGAGPAKLPEEVMREVQKEFLSYGNTKVSVLELSHRCPDFNKIIEGAQQTLRELIKIPDNYKILFMHGGGTGLFAAIPLNMMSKTGTADYIVTGSWSAKAAKEAAKYGKVNLVVPKPAKYTEIPEQSTWNLDKNASYVYYCDNETVHGIEFPQIPDTRGVPLVADMSSNFLTRPIDVSKFAVIYAGAQKNIGPAGVAIAIVRDDVIGKAMTVCPSIFDFSVMAADNSIHNTPAVFQIYFVGKVFEWIKRNGGVENMAKQSAIKSKAIYYKINDSQGFYICPIKENARSRVNIPFRIKNDDKLEAEFLKGAVERGMMQLKGHRSVGGIRASLYNAVSVKEAETLAKYMQSFYENHKD